MSFSRAFALALLLLCFSTTASAQRLAFEDLAGAAVERVSLGAVGDLDLAVLLGALADEAGVFPTTEAAFFLKGDTDLVILPLERAGDPEARVFLYYRRASKEYFFLRLGSDPLGRPEMRLWSKGDSELRFSQEGAALAPRPGAETFRVSDPALLLKGVSGRAAEALTVPETTACIARVLGITVNTTSLEQLLGSAACSATDTIGTVLTAFNCLSATQAGTLGCTLGIAKLISCNELSCQTPAADCRGQISLGQRLNGSWTSACASANREGSFARYYTFKLTRQTRVRLDVTSSFVDAYLFLLEGEGPNGTVLASDNDSGLSWNPRIERVLPAGTYTLEVTTRDAEETGSFTVAVLRR